MKLLLADRRVPWCAKAVSGCALLYLVSPIQLIPNFIPVLGQLDDLVVLYLGMKLIRKLTPLDVLQECEALAMSSPIIRRISNATGVGTSTLATPGNTTTSVRDDSFQTSCEQSSRACSEAEVLRTTA